MLNSIKICHITSAHPDGDVRIFHKECVSLARAGYETYLVIPNTKTRIENGVNIVSFKSDYKSRKERMTVTVKQALNKALEINADIYHIHDPELLKIVKVLKKANKKVIYDVHEDLPRQILSKHWIAKPLRKIISKWAENYENRVAKKCDAVVTATPFIRKRFSKINSGTINVNNFPKLEELLIDYEYSKKEGNYICYVGGITTTRGIFELVKSLKNTNSKLLLAGTFLEDIKPEVEQIDSWDKVDELGFLSREEVVEVYKKSKIGMVTLHPIINYLDALPVKLFEYMAAGIPVVASNFQLLKEIIEKNNCGFCVDPLNPTEIREAINHLINNPDEAEKMGNNGKRLVKEKYNWKIEEEKLIELYNKLSV